MLSPGLTGGVDEAVAHLFESGPARERWRVRRLVTKGGRPALAPFVFARALLRLVWWRLQGRVDLVHLNLSWKGSTLRKALIGYLLRWLGLPYVVQVHSGGFEPFFRDLSPSLQQPVRSLFAGAGQVLVLGRRFRPMVADLFDLPTDRISVVPNAVDLPEIDRAEDGLGTDQPMILFTGRLWAPKGIDELIEALTRIEHLPWTATLVGDGEVERVRAEIADRGLAARVSVLGWQSRAAIDDLLASASIFAHPSHLEALSVSLLEAMAAQLCCVATEVGAHGDILVDGENALVVEPGDVDALAERLTKVVTDPSLRSALGRQARSTVAERCSTEAVVERLAACYEQVLCDRIGL